jgi:transposase
MGMRRRECRNCARLTARVAELEKQLAAALARIEHLEKQLASARKDSSTSSKPFPPEAVDRAWIYEWPESSLSPDWEPLDEFQTLQQLDLVRKLYEVTEHRARLYRYRPTGEVVAASLPEAVVCAGLVGPRLSALIAYQKGACHMTYRVIETFLQSGPVFRRHIAPAWHHSLRPLSGHEKSLA